MLRDNGLKTSLGELETLGFILDLISIELCSYKHMSPLSKTVASYFASLSHVPPVLRELAFKSLQTMTPSHSRVSELLVLVCELHAH